MANPARPSLERMEVTALHDRALIERYDLLRADLDRTRDTEKRLALHRELGSLAAERKRRHPMASKSRPSEPFDQSP